jgi:hypothetical protein
MPGIDAHTYNQGFYLQVACTVAAAQRIFAEKKLVLLV